VDGLSDCGRYGITIIAFVGSVFSPYYHFAGRRDPENHVAINVALYSLGSADIKPRNRWAMTERGKGGLLRSRTQFRVGPSGLTWKDGALEIDFNEVSLPWPPSQFIPKKISGRIRLVPGAINRQAFVLDPAARHHWQPIAPLAAISVDTDVAEYGSWKGEGYLDTNHGSEPLEDGFERWDWARGVDGAGNAIIFYDALCRDGSGRRIGMRFASDGSSQEFDLPESIKLPRGFWGVKRAIACQQGHVPKVLAGFEDSPFYTRSKVESFLNGERIEMVHETFSGTRLSRNLVRLMLSARMPRRSSWQG